MPAYDVRRAGFAGNMQAPPHMVADSSLPVPAHLLSNPPPPHLSGERGCVYSHTSSTAPTTAGAPGFAPRSSAGGSGASSGGSGNGGGKGGKGKGASQSKGAGHSKGGNGWTQGKGANGSATTVAAKESGQHAQAVDPQSGFDASLRTHLETLREVDCNRTILTRKINRLGFQSAQVLETYFAKYGKVDKVLVSHCYARSRNLRFRPSGLGFVVMSSVEEAQAILADGPDLQISKEMAGSKDTVTINVLPFKQSALEDGCEQE